MDYQRAPDAPSEQQKEGVPPSQPPPTQYDQPGYDQPHPYGAQPGYVQQPAPVVFVNQVQAPVLQDYSFPRGKAASVLLLIVAIFNILFMIIYGARTGLWYVSAFLAPFVFHGAVGVVGVLGSFMVQRSPAAAICCIIAAVISIIVAFWQVVVLGTAVGVYDLDKMWPALIRLIFEAGAFVCSVALVIIPSIQICCCRPQGSRGQVVYQQQNNVVQAQ